MTLASQQPPPLQQRQLNGILLCTVYLCTTRKVARRIAEPNEWRNFRFFRQWICKRYSYDVRLVVEIIISLMQTSVTAGYNLCVSCASALLLRPLLAAAAVAVVVVVAAHLAHLFGARFLLCLVLTAWHGRRAYSPSHSTCQTWFLLLPNNRAEKRWMAGATWTRRTTVSVCV